VAPKKRSRNPFYPLLVLVGVVFAITACGFAVMMVSDINSTGELDPASGGGLIQFFQDHGFSALMIELAVLALATFGAILTDEMWADGVDSATTKGESHGPPPQDE
jgi:hypothetical protein